VTHDKFEEIHNRNIYINIGTEHSGTAIITKENITLTDIQRLPSGRGIAARWRDLYITNVYAPSGTGKKRERDEFFLSRD
jgi:exonuclease III